MFEEPRAALYHDERVFALKCRSSHYNVACSFSLSPVSLETMQLRGKIYNRAPAALHDFTSCKNVLCCLAYLLGRECLQQQDASFLQDSPLCSTTLTELLLAALQAVPLLLLDHSENNASPYDFILASMFVLP